MRILLLLLDMLVVLAASNLTLIWDCGIPYLLKPLITVILLLGFVFINVFPGRYKFRNIRFGVLAGGCDLLTVFYICTALQSAGFIIVLLNMKFDWIGAIMTALGSIAALAVIFWNGIIRIYLTSVQLGLKLRIIGAVFGMAPIINLVILFIMIKKVRTELKEEHIFEENQKKYISKNACATKYPVVLVHGVFFRDSKVLNYWGRIPEALEMNGAVICYGEQQSALSVEKSAAELAERIKSITEKYNCEKVNLIAHSKGGLDCRYAVSKLGCDKYVASLTTINTPHRGCMFVDHLFVKIPENARLKMAAAYNGALRKIGDTEPDFISAVSDLRKSVCEKFNEDVPDADGIFYQSVGSVAKNAGSGRFPLNVSYPMVKREDGENDGLVSRDSMVWGENFRFVSTDGKRGITHADMIDLNRENIHGFDVRSFYVEIVNDLRERGF